MFRGTRGFILVEGNPLILPAQLVREDMPDDQPVAVYHRQKRHMFVLRMSKQPYLEVDPVALDTLDSLIGMFLLVRCSSLANDKSHIVSFLLAERRRRDGSL